MHNRGQLITIDFLMALILVIFCLGVLMSFGELRSYEIKESISYNDLQEKTEAGVIALSSGSIAGCVTNNDTVIPFSYNASKKTKITKDSLGLRDYNVSLDIDGDLILTDNVDWSDNSLTVDLNLITCLDGIKITDAGSAPKAIATLRVGK